MNEDYTPWKERLREAAHALAIKQDADDQRKRLLRIGQCTICGCTGHYRADCPMRDGLIRERDIN